uniref:Uncharacterized protein n=1 Tax=viral metagenome TaxID=1070528 RepID=A0A6M3KSJ0_9ZZZZ
MKKIKQKWHKYCGEDYWYIMASGGDVIAKIPKDEQGEEIAKCIVGLKELNSDICEALKEMLNIFDRALPSNSIGRAACDIAIKTISEAEGR